LIKNIFYRTNDKRDISKFSKKIIAASPLTKAGSQLYWTGLSLSIFSIFISAPLGLLESGSIVDFGENLMFYMQPLIGASVAILFAITLLYIFLPRNVILILGIIFSFIALAMLINQFVFSGEYGDMSNFVFEDGYWLDVTESHKNILLLIVLFAVISYIVKTKRMIYLVRTLHVCLFASLVFALINAYQYYSKRANVNLATETENNKFFSLTKNGQNVVIIMMDRMVGGYIANSLEIIPELKDELKGFTWYPRTLSPGTYTILGVPTITGGYDYLARVVNNDNSNKSLSVRVDEAFRVLPFNFEAAGFATSLIQPSSFFNSTNTEHIESTTVLHPYNNYHKHWRQRNDTSFNKTRVHSKLAHFGLFRSAPVLFRDNIYANGSWQPFNKDNIFTRTRQSLRDAGLWSRTSYYGDINSEQVTAAIKNWAIMEDLSLLTRVIDEPNDQFYYFSNELTHEPWATRPDLTISLGEPVTFSREDMQNFKNLTSIQHLYTVAATMKHLTDWFAWLKENDVWDNTRIIIVSDHGRHVFNPMFSQQNFSEQGLLSKVENHVSWFHAALMIKDFDSASEFNTSDKFMTTADVPWMALDGIVEGVNPYTKNKIEEPANKLPWVGAYTPWRIEDNPNSKYKIENHFIINNPDIFDVTNWQDQEPGTPLPPFNFEAQ